MIVYQCNKCHDKIYGLNRLVVELILHYLYLVPKIEEIYDTILNL
jgi:hypothetical protein